MKLTKATLYEELFVQTTFQNEVSNSSYTLEYSDNFFEYVDKLYQISTLPADVDFDNQESSTIDFYMGRVGFDLLLEVHALKENDNFNKQTFKQIIEQVQAKRLEQYSELIQIGKDLVDTHNRMDEAAQKSLFTKLVLAPVSNNNSQIRIQQMGQECHFDSLYKEIQVLNAKRKTLVASYDAENKKLGEKFKQVVLKCEPQSQNSNDNYASLVSGMQNMWRPASAPAQEQPAVKPSVAPTIHFMQPKS